MEEEKKEESAVKKEADSEKGTGGYWMGCAGGCRGPRAVVGVLVLVLVLAGVFSLGRLSSWHGRVEKNEKTILRVSEPREGFGMRGGAGRMMGREFSATLSGEVTAINGNNLTIKSSDKDVPVIVSADTSYSKAGEIAKQSDLKAGDTIVVYGTSNSAGAVTASAIRIK